MKPSARAERTVSPGPAAPDPRALYRRSRTDGLTSRMQRCSVSTVSLPHVQALIAGDHDAPADRAT